MKLRWSAVAAIGLAAAMAFGLNMPAGGQEPPGIPDSGTARTQLTQLRVAPEGSMDGYDREKFPHWAEHPQQCNTRELVLKRDGREVRTGSDCYPTSGTWTSAYDGASWTKPSDLDIDHVVPLAAAWRSGAAQWTQDRRGSFANDLESPQLIAVTDNVNQEKGDKTPDVWLPPKGDYHCNYAAMWVSVKHKYALSVTDPEKAALSRILDRC